MPELDDIELLEQYARDHSEAAFATLVTRHVNLVYSTALRSVGNTHAAEEITQAVFIILAGKAQGLSHRTILSGWLYQTARLTAANFLRSEIRRQHREQEAYMQSLMNEPEPNVWPQIAPLLDVAMAGLGEKDRNAVVLRFFENKSLGEVGLALGASEAAAKMRVNRALEKLRKFFSKRGIILPAALIAGAVSANSVHAAPVGLAITVTATVAKGSAAAASTLTLVKGALKLMAWTKMKSAAVAGAGLHFDPQDADKDDFTQNCVGGAADSSLTEFWQIHNKGQNIMFADGHSQWCKHYVAGDMTFAYAAMTNWIRY